MRKNKALAVIEEQLAGKRLALKQLEQQVCELEIIRQQVEKAYERKKAKAPKPTHKEAAKELLDKIKASPGKTPEIVAEWQGKAE
jgi:hypothetical protein